METVGAVASIAQLAELAATVVSKLWHYFEAVKCGPKQSRELRKELGLLSELLSPLEEALRNAGDDISIPTSAAITEFRDMLVQMNARVDESRTRGVERLKWPFTRDQNHEYLSRIERYKQTFTAVLEIKNTYWSAHSDLIDRRNMSFIADEVRRGKNKEILDWISPFDFYIRHRELQYQTIKDSGRWFVESEQFTTWAEGNGSSCLLCMGIRSLLPLNPANRQLAQGNQH